MHHTQEKLAVKTAPALSVSATLHLFSTKTLKEKSRVHVSLQQIKLGGCVLNERAPGEPNNDSQSCYFSRRGSAAQGSEYSLNGKLVCPNNCPAAISAARPQRLSSALHIVFEQLVIICHLVRAVFVKEGGIVLSMESPLRESPRARHKLGDNALYLVSGLVVNPAA